MAEKNDERERRILDAAAERIAHYGYDKTTVEEIARDAGISKGAIYLHFKSKEHLLSALLLRETEALKARYFALIDADPSGVSIFSMYRWGLQIIDESPLIKAMYTRDKRVLGDYLRNVHETAAYQQVVSFSNDAIRQFQRQGLIRADVDAAAVSYLLNALGYGLLTADEFSASPQMPSISALGSTLAELLANGLAPRAGDADQQAARATLEQLYNVKLNFIEQRKHDEG